MKILLTGYFGSGNFGDDLLLISAEMVVRDRYPFASIDVFANYGPNLSNFNADPNFRAYVRTLLPSVERLIDWTDEGEYDLLVHAGGGVFGSSDVGPILTRAANFTLSKLGVRNSFRLISIVRTLVGRNPRLRAKRRIALGVGLSSYAPGARKFSKDVEALGSLDRVAFRDSASHARGMELGLRQDSAHFTDLAFGLPITPFLRATGQRPRIGVVPAGNKPGNDVLLQACKADAFEWQRVFLDAHDDFQLIERGERPMLADLVWEPWLQKPSEFMRELSKFDLLVSNRAHGVIVGAMLGIPSIIISSDDKMRSLTGMVPSGTRLFDPHGSADQLMACIRNMLTEREALRNGPRSDVAKQRRLFGEMLKFALE